METRFDMNQWKFIKHKLQTKFPELTESDLDWGHISRDILLEGISSKLGKTKGDLINTIESF